MKTSEAINELEDILIMGYYIDEVNRNKYEQLNSAISCAIDLMKRSEWRPIESAPRDGTRILVYCTDTQKMFVAFFATEIETGQQDWVTAHAKDGTCFLLKSPTRWIPLPDAPDHIPDVTKKVS